MKRRIIMILMGLMFLPFVSKAQEIINVEIQYCNETLNNMTNSGGGCYLYVLDSVGVVIHQELMLNSGTINSFGFLQDLVFETTYNNTGSYSIQFDQECLEENYGLFGSTYTFPLSIINDSAFINVCFEPLSSETMNIYFKICDDSDPSILTTLMEGNCHYFITNDYDESYNVEGTIAGTYIGNGLYELPISFVYYPGNLYSTTLSFDEECLGNLGIIITPNNVVLPLGNANVFCVGEIDFTNNALVYLSSNCISNSESVSLDGVEGCSVYIKDKDGNVVQEESIENLNGNNSNFSQMINFTYYEELSPYTFEFDQECIESLGYEMTQYNYPISGEDSTTFIDVCIFNNSVIDSGCVDLWVQAAPYLGYYQNYTNLVKFLWGNSSNQTITANVIITLPPNVSYEGSYLYTSNFIDNGSTLTQQFVLPPYSSGMDILKFSVPTGVPDGTLHSYLIDIEYAQNNTEIEECNYLDNFDKVNFIVGNSYDPNAKTVGLPEEINPTIQDEFLYTIYFQNTGTAPAQDIYIIDTLSTYLDWSTFEFLRASHMVGIADLGNGVKKFYFDQIWLPDSASNEVESQGFVTFKIKEKADNPVGSEIFNTAYIYFDQNDAIVTNTTYNINAASLGIDKMNELQMKLYPNPSNDFINVTSNNVIERLSIYSLDGRICKELSPNQHTTKINITDLAQGIFLVKIESGNSTKIMRMIKE